MLNPVTDAFLDGLARALPKAALREVAPRYLEEPRGRHHGRAGAVAAPGSAEEVSAVLRLAAEARVGVVPYGGGTGLVSGQVMEEGPAPLILSLERMARVRAVYPDENVIVAEAGATLAAVQAAAAGAGRLFPLSYASEGTAQIGSALAVNSGGLGVLRYGTARELCLGIEAVLPDGQILHGLKRLRKDNTGYDLRHLLIGSEGTLGVITAASLRLYPQPADRAVALIAVPSPEAAIALLARARGRVGEGVSAFELMSGMGLAFLDEAKSGLAQPFDGIPDWCALVELGLSEGAEAALAEIFEAAFEAGEATDGVIAQSGQQADALWALRETIPEANRRIGAVASHDISLPISEIPRFVVDCGAALARVAPVRVNAFGHLGDGNLHYNLFPPEGRSRAEFDGLRADLSRIVHDMVAERGGSFSAEHGVGRLKVGDLERYGDPARLDYMRRIKQVFDPAGIMNPGAVLRQPQA